MANHIVPNEAHGMMRKSTYKEMLQKASGEYKTAIAADAKKRKRGSEAPTSNKKVKSTSSTSTSDSTAISTLVQQHTQDIQTVLEAMENDLDDDEDSHYMVYGNAPHFNPQKYFASSADEQACFHAYSVLAILAVAGETWETRMRGTYLPYAGQPIPETYKVYKGMRVITPADEAKFHGKGRMEKDLYIDMFRRADRFETFRIQLILTFLFNIEEGVKREAQFIKNTKVVEDQKQAMQLDYVQLKSIMRAMVRCRNMQIAAKQSEEKKLSGEKDIKCKLCKHSLRSNDIHTIVFNENVTGPKVCGNCRDICLAWYHLIHITRVLKNSTPGIIAGLKTKLDKGVIPSIGEYRKLLESPENRKSPINVINGIIKNAMESMRELLVIQIEADELKARSMRHFFHPLYPLDDPRGNPDGIQFTPCRLPDDADEDDADGV